MTGLLQGSRDDARDNVPAALAVWDALRAQRGEPLRVGALEVGVHVLCRGGRVQEAAAIVESLQRPRVQVRCRFSALRVAQRGGKVLAVRTGTQLCEWRRLRT